jgi:hypothetical protein
MKQAIPILLILASLLGAGCIELPEEMQTSGSSGGSAEPTRTEPRPLPPQRGTMSAHESHEDTDITCPPGISVPDIGPFCAQRILTVEGDMTLTSLAASVSLVSGDVQVVPSAEGVWSLVATIQTRGLTPQMARDRLDGQLIWSIDGPDGYALDVRREPTGVVYGGSVDVLIMLPASAIYEGSFTTTSGDVGVDGLAFEGLKVASTSGDIAIRDVRASTLDAETSSGDVEVEGAVGRLVGKTASGDIEIDARVAEVELKSSSGSIDARLETSRSGSMNVETSSGDAILELAESPTRGYDLQARTGSGDIEIRLSDGTLEQDGEDAREATFRTSSYDRRDIRSSVSIRTSSGDVLVSG